MGRGLSIPREEHRRSRAAERISPMQWLDALCAGGVPALPATPVLVVVAHPDDETVGAGSRLPRLRHATFIYVTDGAPLDGRDAAHHRLTVDAYRELRLRERAAALSRCGIAESQIIDIGCPDQQAARRLPQLAIEIARWLKRRRPDVLLTHPYEGGHPDHDATAFAVHAAAALLRRQGEPVPAVVEMTSYHRGPSGLQTCVFLPDAVADREQAAVVLDPQQRAFKRSLLDCYATQRDTLDQFALDVERFRPAPAYDFRAEPHPGPLFYEQHAWGLSGAQFRELAAQAMTQLGLEGEL
ncbi:PIG-L family deacetylase [Ramlibacter henchirensis]|uniref:PIG-L family deacetylase n=2 Tax=Ramlibacter henchirensis TaxID=204072 RepID=A0A4Z0C8B9_9BURK|nr:PIG-L family deacetylase [Ramlibacter henchirensis]